MRLLVVVLFDLVIDAKGLPITLENYGNKKNLEVETSRLLAESEAPELYF